MNLTTHDNQYLNKGEKYIYMFDFKGKLSKECEDFLYKKQLKMELISIGITCAVFGIFIIVFAILLHPICLIGFLLFPLMFAASFLSKKGFLKNMPNRIRFDFEEDTIFYYSEKRKDYYLISDIDKIFDYGNFYHIKFKGVPDSYYVLQKDLIVQGTISKFEERFKNKIRRVEK